MAYDYVITFNQEIRTVRQRKPSLVSLLLITTRWTLLLEAVSQLIPITLDLRLYVNIMQLVCRRRSLFPAERH